MLKSTNHLEWLRVCCTELKRNFNVLGLKSQIIFQIRACCWTGKESSRWTKKPQRRYEQAKVRFTTEERIGKEMKSTRERYECLDQAYDVALKLQRYSDGKNFVRF